MVRGWEDAGIEEFVPRDKIPDFDETWLMLDSAKAGVLTAQHLYRILGEVGCVPESMSLREVEEVFLGLSDEALEKGITRYQFANLLDRASRSSVIPGTLGHVLWKNLEGIRTYGFSQQQKFQEEKARSIKIRHTPLSPSGRLASFVDEDTRRCVRCRKTYCDKDNKDTACCYHPGKASSHQRVIANLDETTYKCCGRVQIGSNPVLQKAPGCCSGRHVTRDEMNAIEAEQRKNTITTK